MSNDNTELEQAVSNLVAAVRGADVTVRHCEPIEFLLEFASMESGDYSVIVTAKMCCQCPSGSVCRACRMSDGNYGTKRVPIFDLMLPDLEAESVKPHKKKKKKTKKKRVAALRRTV